MPNTLADRFIEALLSLESSGNPDPLITLFTADAEIGNVVAPEKFHGSEGAREFWTKYRGAFENLQSTFRNRIVAGDRIALEWSTQGASGTGNPVEYEGVSILEVKGDRISRFHAYFDPAALGRQMEIPDTKAAES